MSKDDRTGDLLAFLDDDLREEYNEFRVSAPGSDAMRKFVLSKQEKRNRRRAMTPVARRRDVTREELERTIRANADTSEHIAYAHTVLALCGFPYRRPPEGATEYKQTYGRNSLIVQAGHVLDPETGAMVKPGLPYGPKARLLMLHVCTEALRQNSDTIRVADSLSAFIRELGYEVSGGKNGTVGLFKEQMTRLAAANMSIGLFQEDRAHTIQTHPIKEFCVWLPQQARRRVLWKSELTLEHEFFVSLKRFCLPVDIRVMRAFAHSARQIDIILWMDYRVKRLNKPRFLLTWPMLKEQFGADVAEMSKFRQTLRDDLKRIAEVFPKLPARLTDEGLFIERRPEGVFNLPKRGDLRRLGG
jgi:DNA-binding phage protein